MTDKRNPFYKNAEPRTNNVGQRANWAMSDYRGADTLDKVKEYLNGAYQTWGPVPNVPSLAVYLGTGTATLRRWVNSYPEFAAAVHTVLDVQHAMLIAGGLSGAFNPMITKLLLGTFGYSDKVDTTARLMTDSKPETGPAVFVGVAKQAAPVTIEQAPEPASQPEPASPSQPASASRQRVNPECLNGPLGGVAPASALGDHVGKLRSLRTGKPDGPEFKPVQTESALERRRRQRLNGAS